MLLLPLCVLLAGRAALVQRSALDTRMCNDQASPLHIKYVVMDIELERCRVGVGKSAPEATAKLKPSCFAAWRRASGFMDCVT